MSNILLGIFYLFIIVICKDKKMKQENSNIDVISTLLEQNGKIVLLDGNWGSGKTYRWNNIIKPSIKKKNKIYVSLFGVKNIEEIKERIFSEYINNFFNTDNTLKSFSKIILLSVSCFIISFILSLSLVSSLNVYSSNLPWYILVFYTSVILLFLGFYKNIIMYFLNKYIGVNYLNVDIKKIFNSNDTVFCFDDLERISENNSSIDEFFGFFRTLTTDYGYSILLIANCDKLQKNDLVSKYKEKSIDFNFKHRHENDKFIDIITAKIDEKNSTLKDTINNLYNDFTMEKNGEYSPEDIELITEFSSNIRYYEKTINNMSTIYSLIGGQEASYENEILHSEIIRLVALITYHIEYNKLEKEDDYYENSSLNTMGILEEVKPLERIFNKNNYYTYDLKDLYKVLVYGSNSSNIIELFTHNNTGTNFEKHLSSLHHPLKYTTNEINEIVSKAKNMIENEEKLFSSYSSMNFALGTYWVFCNYADFKQTRKIETKLLKAIENTINNNDTNFWDDYEEHRSYGYEIDSKKQSLYINKIDLYILQKTYNQIEEEAYRGDFTSNLLNGLKDDTKKFFYILLLNKADNFAKFSELKTINYDKYFDIISTLSVRTAGYKHNKAYIAITDIFYKNKNDLLTIVCNKIRKDMNKVLKGDNIGLSEKRNVENHTKELDNIFPQNTKQ